jgi:hypothetical protein
MVALNHFLDNKAHGVYEFSLLSKFISRNINPIELIQHYNSRKRGNFIHQFDKTMLIMVPWHIIIAALLFGRADPFFSSWSSLVKRQTIPIFLANGPVYSLVA